MKLELGDFTLVRDQYQWTLYKNAPQKEDPTKTTSTLVGYYPRTHLVVKRMLQIKSLESDATTLSQIDEKLDSYAQHLAVMLEKVGKDDCR